LGVPTTQHAFQQFDAVEDIRAGQAGDNCNASAIDLFAMTTTTRAGATRWRAVDELRGLLHERRLQHRAVLLGW